MTWGSVVGHHAGSGAGRSSLSEPERPTLPNMVKLADHHVRAFNDHIRECPMCEPLELILCWRGRLLEETVQVAAAAKLGWEMEVRRT